MKKQTKVKNTGRSIIIRAKVSALIITLLMASLIARLANLQLIGSEQYRNDAIEQYTHEISITAKRGTIYDREMKQLAVSATVYNIFVSPNEIEDDTQMLLIANKLSEILDVDRDSIITKCQNKISKYQVIKKAVEDAEEMQIRALIKEHNLSGIVNLEETTKRYYPYSSLASHMLGFVGTDNNGLAGIEFTYDEYLRGTNGRAVIGRNAAGKEMPFKFKSYIEAQNGLGVVTTIDYTIQSILEKYIYEAYLTNKPNGNVTGIIMDVNTGEILASAMYPNFDLNNHVELTDYYQAKLFAFNGTDEETAAYKTQLLYEMWDNSMVSKTYEPGSTFKIITSAMALEEAVIKETDTFYCAGSIVVGGWPIDCHIRGSHGLQTFPVALKNSCNPAFVQIGTKVGTKLFEKYFEVFGYTQPSGTDILGEAASIYFRTTGVQFEAVELAVYSFGQTFKVTPLQHLRAVSTIANGGSLVTPHVVKSLVDENGATVKTFDYEIERQVISKETCSIIINALTNSTKNASVSGYNVVSKTGTSQKRDKPGNFFISSCVTFAPAEDPQIAILVLVDEPTGTQYYGSLVAAPVIANVLREVLPYMGIEPTHAEETNVEIKNYIGSDIASAKIALENLGIKCVVKGDGSMVMDQIPAEGSIITENGLVVLYTGDSSAEATIKVPSVLSFTPTAANKAIINNNLNISIKGVFNNDYTNCTVVSQSPAAGSYVAPGTVIEVEFRYNEEIE